ncbi:hypothetical protein Tco_0441948 [Tanacetum coccineum]
MIIAKGDTLPVQNFRYQPTIHVSNLNAKTFPLIISSHSKHLGWIQFIKAKVSIASIKSDASITLLRSDVIASRCILEQLRIRNSIAFLPLHHSDARCARNNALNFKPRFRYELNGGLICSTGRSCD